MLNCLDCLRWGESDLYIYIYIYIYRLTPHGDARVQVLIDRRGLQPTSSE